MSAFRLWSSEDPPPDIGDVLLNVDTGNRWMIDAVRESRPRDMRGYTSCWAMKVHRLAPDEQPHPEARVLEFARFPGRS